MFQTRVLLVISIFVFVFALILAESWVLSLESRLRGRILRIQFVIMLQMLMILMSLFVWKNLTLSQPEGTDQPHWIRSSVWKCILICFLVLAHSSYISNVFLVRTEPTVIALVCYFCLGVQVQMCTFLILSKVYNFVLKLIGKAPAKKITVAMIAVLYAFSIGSYGFYKINQPPVIRHVSIPIKGLSPNLDGFTITLLSDIHLGPTVGKTQLEKAVQICNSIISDIVVIDGDLVDGQVSDLKEAIQPLQNLKSKHGILYVTGNHEYFTMDVENWMTELQSLGVKVLHNMNVKIPEDNEEEQTICFVGVNDLEADRIRYNGHGMKLDSAIEGCSSEQTVILLAHQPHAAKMAITSGHKIDLILNGHTHGGQVFPMVIGAYLFNPFYVGLYQRGETYIYVTPGTYYWGIPMRVFTQHEITKITLVSS